MFDRLFGADEDEGDGRSVESEPEPPSSSAPAPEPDAERDLASIRHSISGMESLSREQRRLLAGYAYILVRVARADGEINDA